MRPALQRVAATSWPQYESLFALHPALLTPVLQIIHRTSIDIERCACGGKLKIIAVIEEPAVIEKILTHMGLSPQPPPRAKARRVDLFQGD